MAKPKKKILTKVLDSVTNLASSRGIRCIRWATNQEKGETPPREPRTNRSSEENQRLT